MELAASFIECPQCHGFGYTLTPRNEHIVCSLCNNQQSILGFVENDLIYWGLTITPQTIRARELAQLIEQVINFILVLVSIGGIISFLLAVVDVNTHGLSFSTLLTDPSLNMLNVWLSLLADLFLYYRLEHSAELHTTLKAENKLAKFKVAGSITDWNYWIGLPMKKKIDASIFFANSTLDVLDRAFHLTVQARQMEVRPIHLLLALMETVAVKNMLYRLEINHTDLQAAMERIALRQTTMNYKNQTPEFGADIRKALLLAYAEARQHQRTQVGAVEVFVGCILAEPVAQDALYEREVDLKKIRQLAHWSNLISDVMQRERTRRRHARGKPKTIMNRAMTARPTDHLDSVSQDFTLMAKGNAFLPIVGRDAEMNEVFRILQEAHTSVLLVGESGGGKSTILQGIANLMTAEHVPIALQDKRLVVTDPGAIIAGAANIGGLEQKMQAIIHDIIMAGNVIWGIEDIHTLLGAGSTGSSIDIGKILMNYISQGYIKVIGTTTTKEFQKYIQNQDTFLRRFQIVKVPELKPDDAILVLEGRSPYLESKYHVYFTYDAIAACVDLSERFIQDRHLPAKALDIMEEAAVYAKEHAGERSIVTRNIVATVVAEKTNVAVQAISEDEATKLLNLETELHERVIGQDEAVIAIARALRRARQDIRDLHRPIASLLFLGPTGVGKTETAKAIASVYFGSEAAMMRFDMSEYQTPDSVAKLIGAPSQVGLLTEAIRKTPFGIVLLDELEKAYPDVLNLFLQVMEDGRLTDGNGTTFNFSNCMIIATSNAGTDLIQQRYKNNETSEQIKNTILNSGGLQNVFRTEFLNRFDHIAVFTPLSPAQLTLVCDLLLKQLAKQLQQRGLTLLWSEETAAALAQQGYDPQFGARPLRRFLQDTTQDAIAKLLLSKQLGRRDTVELLPNGEVKVIKAEVI